MRSHLKLKTRDITSSLFALCDVCFYWCAIGLAAVILFGGCGSGTPDKPISSDPAVADSGETQGSANSVPMAKEKDEHTQQLGRLAEVEDVERLVSGRLKKIASAFQKGELNQADGRADVCKKLVAPQFSSHGLLPEQVKDVRTAKNGFSIRRMTSKQNGEHTFDSLDEALAEILQPVLAGERQRAKFKVYRIEVEGRVVTTEVNATLFSAKPESSTELNAKFAIDWTLNEKLAKPVVTRWDVIEFETAEHSGSAVAMVDHTNALLGSDELLKEQLSWGAAQWTRRIAESGGMGHHGMAIGDINGDGRDDVYLCQSYGLPNRLLVQQEDQTVVDMAPVAGVDLCDHSRSALMIDLDNDGDQDLVIAAESFLLVYENEWPKISLREKIFNARNSMSISAVDYDHDGDLDLYSCGYDALFDHGGVFAFGYPYHDANNGGRNVLNQNDGNFKFSDVTRAVGLDEANTRFSFAASWDDFDNDGDFDLYVANDFGRNNFYENQNGKFKNLAAEYGVEDQSFGMSVDWGDLNRDGSLDLYVANMYSNAGNRLAFQENYLKHDPKMRERMQYIARGNSLFMGPRPGEKKFTDASIAANVAMGRWSWGSKLCDLNNDGWQDVVVANGFLTQEFAEDL